MSHSYKGTFSYLKARFKSLGISLKSCLWFHCMILCVCCKQYHAWKRNKRQALVVMDLHLLKTPATSASLPASSSNSITRTDRNEEICTFTTFWNSFTVACWDFQWLHHLYVHNRGGWGKAVVKQTPPRHTYCMYGCNEVKVMLLLTACSLAPGDHKAVLLFRLHWKRKLKI